MEKDICFPELGDVFRYYRKKKGYNIKNLANGISDGYISKLENGNPISETKVVQLKNNLGITDEEIISLKRFRSQTKMEISLIESLIDSGNTEEAEKRMTKLEPEFFQGYVLYLCGKIFLKKRDLKKAKENFQEAIRTGCSDEKNLTSMCHYELGYIYYCENDTEKTIKHMNDSLEIFDDNSSSFRYFRYSIPINRAYFLFNLKQNPKILEVSSDLWTEKR